MSKSVRYYDEESQGLKDAGYEGPGWYFWDETESFCYGPFESKSEAETKCIEYASTLEK